MLLVYKHTFASQNFKSHTDMAGPCCRMYTDIPCSNHRWEQTCWVCVSVWVTTEYLVTPKENHIINNWLNKCLWATSNIPSFKEAIANNDQTLSLLILLWLQTTFCNKLVCQIIGLNHEMLNYADYTGRAIRRRYNYHS